VEKRFPILTVEVGGVGYELEIPLTTFAELPDVGEKISLFTHLAIRENAHSLYGFADRIERDLFRVLIGVSGVGPRLGLAILSGMKATDFIRCVNEQDTDSLVALPGVGRKRAARLLLEIRDSLPMQLDSSGDSSSQNDLIRTQASSALESLGYSTRHAAAAVKAVSRHNMTLEETVAAALKKLAG